MRRTKRWIAVVVVLAIVLGIVLFACILQRPKYTNQRQTAPSEREKAARSDRRIGILARSGERCPEVPLSLRGWEGKPLFPLPPPVGGSQRYSSAALKAGLDRYCLYQYTGDSPIPRIPKEFADQFDRFDTDTAALRPSADALEPMTWSQFEERFLAEAGGPSSTASPAPPVAPENRVRLVFLDSQPTGEGPPRPTCRRRSGVESRVRSLHGYSLGQMAARLACPGGVGSCGVSIASRLVLPIPDAASRTPSVLEDLECGGVVGSLGSLAEAIYGAISDWERDQGGTRHLILNLSAAWDGQQMESWTTKLSNTFADDQAVWAALDFAAEKGVLVIAAAGNRTPGPGPSDAPLLPAGWQGVSFPDRPGEVMGGPLLYAVSGVDATGWPLANTRALGEAPLVAYADHAVVQAFDGAFSSGALAAGERTATLTGSSVATAVVSSTAAILWGQNPGLSRSELMKKLYGLGESVCRVPKFGSEVTEWDDVHQIRFAKIVAGAAARRPPVRSCTEPPASPWAPLNLRGFTASESSFSLTRQRYMLPFDHSCHAQRIFMAAGTEPDPLCPDVYPSLVRDAWAHPQPGEDPCPSCAMGGVRPPAGGFSGPASTGAKGSSVAASALVMAPAQPYTLFVAIDSDWGSYLPAGVWPPTGGRLEGASLEVEGLVHGSSSPLRVAYAIDLNLSPGQAATLYVAKQDDLETILSATLSYYVGTGTNRFSVLTPLYLGSKDGAGVVGSAESAASRQVAAGH